MVICELTPVVAGAVMVAVYGFMPMDTTELGGPRATGAGVVCAPSWRAMPASVVPTRFGSPEVLVRTRYDPVDVTKWKRVTVSVAISFVNVAGDVAFGISIYSLEKSPEVSPVL